MLVYGNNFNFGIREAVDYTVVDLPPKFNKTRHKGTYIIRLLNPNVNYLVIISVVKCHRLYYVSCKNWHTYMGLFLNLPN